VESPRFLWKVSENRSVNTRSVNRRSVNRRSADLNETVDYLRRSAKSAAQKQMRPGPATQAASFVVSCSASSPLGGGMTASARQRSKGVPHLPKPVAGSSSRDHKPATAAVASGPGPAPCFKERRTKSKGGGGRNARATSRACARFLECPPTIHPRESPTAAGSAAIIRQAQELSRFAELTLRQILAPRNTKNLRRCAEAVEDASSLWKP